MTGGTALYPLPPNPPVALTGGLQQVLSEADRALERLDGSIQTLQGDPKDYDQVCELRLPRGT